MNKDQHRVAHILDSLKTMAIEDKDNASVILESLDAMLDDLLDDDFFGTEGQNDPRGDERIET